MVFSYIFDGFRWFSLGFSWRSIDFFFRDNLLDVTESFQDLMAFATEKKMADYVPIAGNMYRPFDS